MGKSLSESVEAGEAIAVLPRVLGGRGGHRCIDRLAIVGELAAAMVMFLAPRPL